MALLKLKDRHCEPPSGWTHKDVTSLVWIRSATFEDLVKDARQHRVTNGYPVPENFAGIIEDQICKRIDPSLVVGKHSLSEDSGAAGPIRSLQSAGLRTQGQMQKWKRNSGGLVGREEVDRRVSVCCVCSYNPPTGMCLGCNGYDSWLWNWLGRRVETHQDKRLQACTVDGGLLLAHVQMDFVFAPDYDLAYPAHCWKKKKEKA